MSNQKFIVVTRAWCNPNVHIDLYLIGDKTYVWTTDMDRAKLFDTQEAARTVANAMSPPKFGDPHVVINSEGN